MNNKSKKQITKNLESHLKRAKRIDDFLKLHDESLVNQSPGQYLDHLITKSGVRRATLLNQISLSKSYFYEILSDKKVPSRNNFLQILIALSLPFDECQTALKLCGYSQLYARNRWDVVIIYCIENRLSLIDTNLLLESQNLPILY